MTMEYHSAYIMKKAKRESILNRQRRAALLAALITALGLWVALSGNFNLTLPGRDNYTGGVYVSVERGDSLWSIAGEYKPISGDTRAFMQTIAKMNGLSGTTVYEGQVLYIPQ
ncbi:MAG: LysM peptidoglycan-binding domain-containing protein [Oscillospiraceae bacterium]|nr:LysM peptidoglycan-binding domain-containing protein [Oscillospiraceae bacterium]